ncbi:ATP-binding protein [Aeromonas hydrophila]|uniref:ATP-binding protein n=1 Tax=Aeromonas hydrophila TaxID=644 RepID=UPI001C7667E0|nr:ATP-binding protein [Aeromonas hydrophila]QWL75354.1 ATP-binding protein [Aeromonas hydrophila]
MRNIEEWKKNNPYFINKISVDGLLSEYDVEWNLEDVNVLVGKNGSGKTSLFKIIKFALLELNNHDKDQQNHKLFNKFKKIKVELNNGKHVIIEVTENDEENKMIDVIKTILSHKNIKNSLNKNMDKESMQLLEDLVKQKDEPISNNISHNKKSKEVLILSRSQLITEKQKNILEENVSIEFISTFDMLLLSREQHDKYSNQFYSELDVIISDEQNKLRENILSLKNQSTNEYKESIKQKKETVLSVIENNKLSQINILKKELNLFFNPEGKSIEINDSGNLVFRKGKNKILLRDLSSGEKQLILILLKTLNNSLFKPCIIFMDEPEISLHVSWQKQLISSLKRIARQSQIIVVSHSPAVVIDSWMNKLVDIKDIVLKNNEISDYE